MKYKLAIFDMDGTVLDTLDDLHDAMNHTLEVFGCPLRNREQTRMSVGNGIRKLIERSTPKGVNLDLVEKEFKEYYGIHCKDKTKPYDGMIEMIQELKDNGIVCAVVSNKADYAVQILVKEFFNDVFDFALGERADIKKKPSPDMVNECLRVLNIKRDEAIYIGDSETDVQTAKNSNMKCIGCTYGFRDRKTLVDEGADYIIDHVFEIKNILLD